MSIYPEEELETLRTRKLLKEWTADGLLTGTQSESLKEQTASGLRTTNIVLRIVLFFFTLFCVAAATALFFLIFIPRSSPSGAGVLFLFFTIVTYAAAEITVAQAGLYHFGIEEALAVASLGFLCEGLVMSFTTPSPQPHPSESLIPIVCAAFAFWIWQRFRLWYMFPAAMILVASIPDQWTSSTAFQHGIVAACYAIGLIAIIILRVRHRLNHSENTYSLAESFLWFGLYLTINLKATVFSLPMLLLGGGTPASPPVGHNFYWITWVLAWCLPPIILDRAIHQKDRFVLAAGGLLLLFTFITNKPYLGWPRHTWDPILLGIVLTGAALYIRHWLAQGPAGVRHGFTAARLSTKDEEWLNTTSSALGLISLNSLTLAPQPNSPDLGISGGASGGAGATRDL